MEPSSPPPPPPVLPGAVAAGASGKAVTILVLAIVGLVCCPLTAPVAWLMGHLELRAIRAGQAPAANQGLAQIGMVLGIIGSALFALGLLWIFAFGGLAALGVLLNQ
jgi:hypothetical protein